MKRLLWIIGVVCGVLCAGAALSPASATPPGAGFQTPTDDDLPATLTGARLMVQFPQAASGRPLYADDEGPMDRWWARDKFRHVTYSFLWTLSTQYVLVSKANWSERDALPASIGSAFLAGLGKELYDWQLGPRRLFSWRDMVANGVGIALGTGVILL